MNKNRSKIKITFQYFLSVIFLFFLLGCVNLERNYKPAGFNSTAEVKPYLKYSTYFASKITPEEWNLFYKRFPEYWQDMQKAKSIGSTIEFHPWYVSYAMRWVTLNVKIKQWDAVDIKRLQLNSVEIGDDIFKTIYALSPPNRIIWDNDFEILIYKTHAIKFVSGKIIEIKECNGCSELPRQFSINDPVKQSGMTEEKILEKLKYERPKY